MPTDLRSLTLGEIIDALGASPAPAESEYIDSKTSPAGQRAVRAAVHRGELDGFHVGKKLLVKRAAHTAWIESHRVSPKEKTPVPANLLDRLGTRRAANG